MSDEDEQVETIVYEPFEKPDFGWFTKTPLGRAGQTQFAVVGVAVIWTIKSELYKTVYQAKLREQFQLSELLSNRWQAGCGATLSNEQLRASAEGRKQLHGIAPGWEQLFQMFNVTPKSE